jgi:hypothetical protein
MVLLQMSKNVITFIVFFIFLEMVQGQEEYFPEIIPLNGTELCSGYDLKNNTALIGMFTPIPSYAQRENIYAVYTWTAEHPKGNKTWNTSSKIRQIPLPWEGSYLIKVKVEFIHKDFPAPFAGATSNSLKIFAKNCSPSIRIPSEKENSSTN